MAKVGTQNVACRTAARLLQWQNFMNWASNGKTV